MAESVQAATEYKGEWPAGTIPILLEVTQSMTSAQSVSRALDRLAHLALGATGADRCAILVHDPSQGSKLLPAAGDSRIGNPRELWETFRHMDPIDFGAEPGRLSLWRSPKTVTLNDVEASPLIPEDWKAVWGSKSLALAFLRAGGEAYGVIAVDYVTEAHGFTESEAQLLGAIADAAGAALRNARLVEQVQHGLEVQRQLFECCAALRSENSPTKILELVADGFMSLLNVVRCHIGLVGPDQKRIHSIVWRGREPEDGLREMVIAEFPDEEIELIRSIWEADPHYPIVIPNVREFRDRDWKRFVPADIDVALLVPLADGTRIIGVILAGREGDKLFTQEELAVAIAFADQAAVALSRARLNQVMEVRLRVNEALHRLSDLVVSTSKLRPLIAQLNETVCKQVGFRCLGATFADPKLRDLLKLPPPSEEEQEILRRWRRAGLPQTGRGPISEVIGESLAVSIVIDGKVAGIFWSQMPENAGPEELDLAYTIAGGLGEVAQKAKLRRTLERRSQELAIASERERIAHDLHDTVGQTLYGIGLRLEDALCEIEERSELRRRLEDLRALAAQGVSDTRSAVYALSFLQVRARGLVPSLRALVRQFSRASGVYAEIRTEGQIRRMPEEITSALYRVAHEALVNVDRHARATGVVLALTSLNGRIDLTIRDDGVGIGQRQVADWRSAAHFGLRTMSRSIEEVGGKLQVLPGSPRGLVIEVSVPLNQRNS